MFCPKQHPTKIHKHSSSIIKLTPLPSSILGATQKVKSKSSQKKEIKQVFLEWEMYSFCFKKYNYSYPPLMVPKCSRVKETHEGRNHFALTTHSCKEKFQHPSQLIPNLLFLEEKCIARERKEHLQLSWVVCIWTFLFCLFFKKSQESVNEKWDKEKKMDVFFCFYLFPTVGFVVFALLAAILNCTQEN